MVIQRIQTLFLLIATALLIVFIFVPFGYWNIVDAGVEMGLSPLRASAQTGLLIPLCVAALLSFVAIFLFKKSALQKGLVVLSIIATLVTVAMVIYLLTAGYVDTDSNIVLTAQWGCGGLIPVAAIIMEIAAYRGISADQKLLRSYDRLR
ncbi:MAG: DUF4293 domain-containing protein [Paramuribaculum sp.]|nr:DUF4293 domain-containing protein [Paramuribaculum sp.]